MAVAGAELAEIEVRLGTDLERPDDFDRCVALAHQIRNLIHLESLRQEMEMMLAARADDGQGRPARRAR
jgi:hypothetical protein